MAPMRALAALFLCATLATCAATEYEPAGLAAGIRRCVGTGIDIAQETGKSKYVAFGIVATPLCAMAAP